MVCVCAMGWAMHWVVGVAWEWHGREERRSSNRTPAREANHSPVPAVPCTAATREMTRGLA